MIAKAVGCLTNGFMTVVCAFPANGKRNARYIIFFNHGQLIFKSVICTVGFFTKVLG